MDENFVPFELAVKLKDKGFKEKCIAYYWEKINEHTPSFLVEDNMPEDGLNILDLLSNHNQAEWSPFIDAPTILQVLKWLRNTYNLHVETYPCGLGMWKFLVTNITTLEERALCDKYTSSEKATLKGIEYVLDNLI